MPCHPSGLGTSSRAAATAAAAVPCSLPPLKAHCHPPSGLGIRAATRAATTEFAATQLLAYALVSGHTHARRDSRGEVRLRGALVRYPSSRPVRPAWLSWRPPIFWGVGMGPPMGVSWRHMCGALRRRARAPRSCDALVYRARAAGSCAARSCTVQGGGGGAPAQPRRPHWARTRGIARARRASAPRASRGVRACAQTREHTPADAWQQTRSWLRESRRECPGPTAGGNVLGAAAGSTARQRPRWPRRESLCRDSTGGRACGRSISRLAAVCGQEVGWRRRARRAPGTYPSERGEYWAPHSAGFFNGFINGSRLAPTRNRSYAVPSSGGLEQTQEARTP